MFCRTLLSALIAISSMAPQEFEVASIRSNNSGSGSSSSHSRNGRYESTNESLLQLVRLAFQAREYQIIGPDWMKSDRYDIRAKAPDGVPDTQIPQLLQSLLTDRFKMKFHREVRQMPIFALLVAKEGSKLVRANESDPAVPNRVSAPESRTAPGASAASGGGGSSAGTAPALRLSTMHSVGTLSSFAGSLSRSMDRPVMDMTGLAGDYDIRLAYKPESAPAEDSGPSIFTAITEQLGLRLEARKGPVDVIVIDSIEKVREQ